MISIFLEKGRVEAIPPTGRESIPKERIALRLQEAMIADLRLEDVSSDAISADTRLFDKEEGLGFPGCA